jgi:hypothetical protein
LISGFSKKFSKMFHPPSTVTCEESEGRVITYVGFPNFRLPAWYYVKTELQNMPDKELQEAA